MWDAVLRLSLNWLFRVLRPPLAIFLILVLGSFFASYAIIHFTATSHLSVSREGFLRLQTDYFELEFPKSWYALRWEEKNGPNGTACGMIVASADLIAVAYVSVSDEVAMQKYMAENNLTDTSSIVLYEANRMYNWSLQSNSNATLSFIENGTLEVSGLGASYTHIRIVNGLQQDDAFYNLTSLTISCKTQQKLAQIAFWGKEEDCLQTRNTFDTIVDSIKM